MRERALVAQNHFTGVERVNVTAVVEPSALDDLIGALRRRGFRVLGPTVRDGAIVYDELESAAELPVGWTDRQEAGTYRLERREDDARFGYAVGPHSWKQFLFPARLRLWRARTANGGEPVVEEEPLDETPLAFIGVRACELERDRDPGQGLHRRQVRRPRLRRPPRGDLRRRRQLRRARRARASASRWTPARASSRATTSR